MASWEESSLDKKVFRSALNEAIESLQVNHKEVFYLRFIEELSVKEIAEVTDVSEGTVKSRIYYATKKVTAQLSEFNPQYDGTIFKMN